MAPLYGLVLAGGRSHRMGSDKGRMRWHEKEQRYWLADLLRGFCADVFISCRCDQYLEIASHNYKVVTDEFEGAGPLGALVSAYHSINDAALLVAACDLPFLDAPAVDHLVHQRNADAMATVYKSPVDQLPEPLVAIWEPRAAPALQQAIYANKLSLRLILLQNSFCDVSPLNPRALLNVNTPDDYRKANVKMWEM